MTTGTHHRPRERQTCYVGLALIVALIATADQTDARPRPVRDQMVGQWVVHQEEAGSPLRSLFTTVHGEHRGDPDLLVECNGGFTLMVTGSKAAFADDGPATLIFSGNKEVKADARKLSPHDLYMVVSSIRNRIVGIDRLGVRMRNRDGSPHDVFFRLGGLWSERGMLDKICPQFTLPWEPSN